MKLRKLYMASICSLFTLVSFDALAIDQVILKNGDVIQGKILSDVPNRHVDIQLVNGTKRRYNQGDVSSVERDVPSNVDSHMAGSTSELFFGANLGGFTNLALTSSELKFNWGGRFGINVSQLGDFSKLAFALAYNNTSGTVNASLGELMVQALFRKVGNSGFYFGPQIGLAFISVGFSGLSASTSEFEYGALLGYDYYFSDGFSLGPVVQLTHFTGNTPLKFGLDFSFHF